MRLSENPRAAAGPVPDSPPTACAATFTDAHGNEIELDDSLEAYAAVDARRRG